MVYHVCFSQYLCVNMEMYVECTMWILSPLAYLLLVCMIVCGFLPCDDHQPYWCEQTSIGLTLGTHSLELSSNSSFSRTWRDFVLRLGHVGPFLFVMNMLEYCVHHIPKFCTLWIFLYVVFYLNWFYPFNRDVAEGLTNILIIGRIHSRTFILVQSKTLSYIFDFY